MGIIVLVREKKSGRYKQKYITVPIDCDIKEGDYVELIKVR